VCAKVNTLQAFGEECCREAAHPLVEVSKNDLRLRNASVVDDGAQATGLISPLEEGGAEMNVIEVERVIAEGDVNALAAARLAGLPRQVVLRVMDDRMATEDDVAEQGTAQMTRRRHDPAHAEQCSELLGVAGEWGRRRSPPGAR
jgi:hypothetical protein